MKKKRDYRARNLRRYGVRNLREAIARLTRTRRCRVSGCKVPTVKWRASPYCSTHWRRVRLYGAPLGKRILKSSYAGEHTMVRAFIRASLRNKDVRRKDPTRAADVQAALDWVKAWFADCTDLEAQRLAATGRTAKEIVADVIACWLHIRKQLDGNELDSALFIAAAGRTTFVNIGSRYDHTIGACVIVRKKRSPTAMARLRVGGLLRQRLARLLSRVVIWQEAGRWRATTTMSEAARRRWAVRTPEKRAAQIRKLKATLAARKARKTRSTSTGPSRSVQPGRS